MWAGNPYGLVLPPLKGASNKSEEGRDRDAQAVGESEGSWLLICGHEETKGRTVQVLDFALRRG